MNILITGGTGSFGNVLIDFYLSKFHDLGKIVVFSRDENKQAKMKSDRKNKHIEYIIGDIRDYNKLLYSFRGIDLIYHAAALKHVPVGEEFPYEVVKTSIIGTKNVMKAAEICGVSKVVNLSTDKAVNPVNAYGMAKGLSEKIVATHRGSTIGVNLRYGNVMGSRGSVIPLFINRLKENLPIPITNSRMTRFLLSLEDAVKLSYVCATTGKSGDLFVIKSSACTIETLIGAITRGLGIKEGDYSEELIGIRPGEKIHETLLTPEEVSRGTTNSLNGIEYFTISKEAPAKDYSEEIPFTSANTTRLDVYETLEVLNKAGVLDHD